MYLCSVTGADRATCLYQLRNNVVLVLEDKLLVSNTQGSTEQCQVCALPRMTTQHTVVGFVNWSVIGQSCCVISLVYCVYTIRGKIFSLNESNGHDWYNSVPNSKFSSI